MAAKYDTVTLPVPEGTTLLPYWNENPTRNLFWLQNAPKFEEVLHNEINTTQHNMAAEVTREQISKTLYEVHDRDMQKLKEQHVGEIQRLQSMINHQNELNRQHLADIHANTNKDLLAQIEIFKTIDSSKSQQIQKLESESEKHKAEITDLKSKLPKKNLTVGKYGGIAEHEAVECIASIVPSYIKDVSHHKRHTATTHGDRHIMTKSTELNPANMLLEVKSGSSDIHTEEIDRFNRNVRQDSEGYINAGYFLSLKVRIPYKMDSVTWEIIEREGKPPVPVVWVHSDDEVIIKAAAVSLVQMQQLCSNMFEARKKTNATEAILAHQNDMEKIRLGFPSIVSFFKSREDIQLKRIDTLQSLIDDIQDERHQVQDMYEKVESIIKNVSFLRELPIPDNAMETFKRTLKTKQDKNPNFQYSMIKINDFSGTARSIIQKAGINLLKERYKTEEEQKSNKKQRTDTDTCDDTCDYEDTSSYKNLWAGTL